MMKFRTRSVVAVAMIAALGIGAPAIATADTTTTTTATTIHVTHAQWSQWQRAEDAYLDQLKVINRTFRASITLARKESHAAIAAARGSVNHQSARAAARAALALSIANAMQARATALATLGTPPAPPAGRPRSAHIVVVTSHDTRRAALS